jgi:hypothetical protein
MHAHVRSQRKLPKFAELGNALGNGTGRVAKMLQDTVAARHSMGGTYGLLTRPPTNRRQADNHSPTAASMWLLVQNSWPQEGRSNLAAAQLLLPSQLTTLRQVR